MDNTDDFGSYPWDQGSDLDMLPNDGLGNEGTDPSGEGLDVSDRVGRGEPELRLDFATPPARKHDPLTKRNGGYATAGNTRPKRMGKPNNGSVAKSAPAGQPDSGSDGTRGSGDSPQSDAPTGSGNTGEPRVGSGRRLKLVLSPKGQPITDREFDSAQFNGILKDLKHITDGSIIATFIIPPQDADNAISLRHAFNKTVIVQVMRHER